MSGITRRIAGVLAVCCLLSGLQAEELWHADEGWGLNLPEGWVLMESRSEAGNLNFSDPAGHAVVQVFRVEGSARARAEAMLASTKASPLATAGREFSFNRRPALWTEATWLAGKIPVHGVILAIEADPSGPAAPAVKAPAAGKTAAPAAPGGPSAAGEAWVLVAFSLDSEWKAYQNALLSVLDSFFVGEAAMYLPGPVSQRTAGDGWCGGPVVRLETGIKASQSVAEREARLLAGYQSAGPDAQKKAWRRFYQMIWKDSYSRLDDVSAQLSKVFTEEKVAHERLPAELLALVQSFKAETYGTVSDLRVPLDAVNSQAGDCDGRGLVYMILLEHLGFSSILLVSPVYRHSMVGLDWRAAGLKGGGFTYPLDKRDWMVAETMAPVPLGQINRDMSDPANWIGFDVHFKP